MARTTTQTDNAAKVQEMPPAPVDNLPAPRPRTNAVNAIVPATWQEVTAIAGAICRARMAPKSYCDRDGNPFPDKVAIAIMHGMEVGMTPMASLQSLAVINGMPSLYGDGLLALVRASGLLEDVVEELEWDNKGPALATCKVKRKGEATWGVMTCARADAEKAGWWNKDGPWRATPHRMMQMRARGWALRDKFADVLRGLRSAEEVEDMVDITPQGSETTTAPAPAEPTRQDFQPVPKDEEIKAAADKAAAPKTQPASARSDSPPQAQAGDGQPEESRGAPTDTSGQPASKQPVHETVEKKPEPKAAKKPEAKVTDVQDQNAGGKITFEDFRTARAFFDFSDPWLADPTRTKADAEAWEAYYGERIKALQQHEYQRIRESVAHTLSLYHAIGKAPEREPGQEG